MVDADMGKGTVTSRGHILLVEDSQDDIDLTLRALNRHEALRISVVQDGAEALDFLLRRGKYAEPHEQPAPDLVLLDINLPKLSGLDVLKELRRNETTRLLPVVMLTTSREEQDILTSYRTGANSYVRKPVSYKDFVEAVNQLGIYWLNLNEAPWPQKT
jgi:two-component system, response regulator